MPILQVDPSRFKTIDAVQLRHNIKKLSPELIAPAVEDYESYVVTEHSAEPIKNMDHIEMITDYLLAAERYRDYMLFIVGINFGLRVSDLRMLRYSDLINDNLTFKTSFPVFEKKTRNTRKKKKNRYITVNTAVIEAVTLYLENTEGIRMSDFMFRSESNHGGNINKPLSIQSINRILKNISNDLDLNIRTSSHTLRKTFCYHQMVMSHNDPRKLLLLQKMLNHSTPAQTLDYIGITSEEIEAAYNALNLGSKGYNYLSGSNIIESETDLAC